MCVRPAWICSAAGIETACVSTCVQRRKAYTHPRKYSTVQYMHLTRYIYPVTATIAASHYHPSSLCTSATALFSTFYHTYYIHTPLLLPKNTLHPSNGPYTPPLRSIPHPSLPPSHSRRTGTTSDPT